MYATRSSDQCMQSVRRRADRVEVHLKDHVESTDKSCSLTRMLRSQQMHRHSHVKEYNRRQARGAARFSTADGAKARWRTWQCFKRGDSDAIAKPPVGGRTASRHVPPYELTRFVSAAWKSKLSWGRPGPQSRSPNNDGTAPTATGVGRVLD